jgi:hypothetical protein
MKKRKSLKPKRTDSGIASIRVGPIWTYITIKIATDRMTLAGAKKAFGRRLQASQSVRRRARVA